MGRHLRHLAAAGICLLALALSAPAFPAGSSGWLNLSFVWPAQGSITTGFSLHYHDGIDIGTLRSLTVKAADGGVVELVGQPYGYAGYGNVVVVRVAPAITTIYAHLSSWNVKPGDIVLAGQPIGIAGCTGICTGTHLHFEVRQNGTPVNPMLFLG